MTPTFTFSPDDMMNPVYCKQCRTHIPLTVSAQGSGICPDCAQAKQQAQTSAFQQQQAAQAQRAAAHQAAQQQAVLIQAKARSLLPYFVIASLVIVGAFACMLTIYHSNVVKPLKQELTQTRSELSDTRRELAATQKELEELTEVVNQNADAANHNNHIWP